ARQIGNQAVLRAERAEAQITTLLGRLGDRERAAERAEKEIIGLRRQLEEQDAAAERAKTDLEALRRTRLFRYTGRARRLYSRLYRMRRVIAPQIASGGLVHYSIDAPRQGQIVEPDLLIPVHGWVVCKQGPVARIDVSINGHDYGKARLGLARPDVAAR